MDNEPISNRTRSGLRRRQSEEALLPGREDIQNPPVNVQDNLSEESEQDSESTKTASSTGDLDMANLGDDDEEVPLFWHIYRICARFLLRFLNYFYDCANSDDLQIRLGMTFINISCFPLVFLAFLVYDIFKNLWERRRLRD